MNKYRIIVDGFYIGTYASRNILNENQRQDRAYAWAIDRGISPKGVVFE